MTTAEDTLTDTDLLRRWYAEHRGKHRCKDVARALTASGHEFTTHRAATLSARLSRHGELVRTQVEEEGRVLPVTYYAATTYLRKIWVA